LVVVAQLPPPKPPLSLIRLNQIAQRQGKSMIVFVSVLFRRLEHETTASD
jgi:hypothetical protein